MDFDSLVDDSKKKEEPAKPLMFDELKDTSKEQPTNLHFDHLQDDSEKYSTPLQQAGAVAEGAAQGYLGPLATLAETGLSKMGVPHLSPEEQAGRREQNPGKFQAAEAVGLGAGFMTGTGEAGLIAKGVGALPKIGKVAEEAGLLAKAGSSAIRGALEMGLIQGGDEVSKALLNKGDPNHPVSAALGNMGASALYGGIFGLGAPAAGKGFSMLADSKIGQKLDSGLVGLAYKLKYPNPIIATPETIISGLENLHGPSFKDGQGLAKLFTEKAPGKIASVGARIVGGTVGGTPGYIAADQAGKFIEKTVAEHMPKAAQKYIGTALLRMAAEGKPIRKIGPIIDYCTNIARGEGKIAQGVGSIFKPGGNEYLQAVTDKDRQKLKDFMEEDGLNTAIREGAQESIPPQYAQGGGIEPVDNSDPIAEHFPEQNVLLNASKARISNYLNSVRPVKNPSKLPFDSEHTDHHKEREYNQALDLALQPLSVLKHIKKGTLLPKHMTAFNAMYPDLHQHLSTKITKEMANQHLKKEKRPPYKIRQALSLFLGANLDSTLTPAGIQAAQSVFQKQNAMKEAHSQSAISKMDDSSRTPGQARQQRMNKN